MSVRGKVFFVLATFALFLIDHTGARRHLPVLCKDLPDALRYARELLTARKDLFSIELQVGANTLVVERPRSD